MCVYQPPVRDVCPNYEVVGFQPHTVTPPELRLFCLLLRIYYFPTAPYLPVVRCPSGGTPPSYPDTPYTKYRRISAQDHLPTKSRFYSKMTYSFVAINFSFFSMMQINILFLQRGHDSWAK